MPNKTHELIFKVLWYAISIVMSNESIFSFKISTMLHHGQVKLKDSVLEEEVEVEVGIRRSSVLGSLRTSIPLEHLI